MMSHQNHRSRISSRTPTKIVESCPTIMLSIIFLWHLFVTFNLFASASATGSSTIGFTSPRRRNRASDIVIGRVEGSKLSKELPRGLLSALKYDLYPTLSDNTGSQITRSQEWIDNSIRYYSTLRRMSNERLESIHRDATSSFFELASDHYFALTEIREGKLDHAEEICKIES